MKTLPVAVQVYSVRDDAERDFKGTMQKIKDMGYDGVELAGLYGMKPAEVKADFGRSGPRSAFRTRSVPGARSRYRRHGRTV